MIQVYQKVYLELIYQGGPIMTKEIRARRNEGKHLKTLCMNKNKFIIKPEDSVIITGVDEPDVFAIFVEPGHTYEIYVKYTNIVTQETYERSCGFVVGVLEGPNIYYNVCVTDIGVTINIEDAPGVNDILRIYACGEMPELCAVIELIDVTNICKDLESKNDTKTETDKYAYAKSNDTKIPSSCPFTYHSNNASEEQVKLFITFLKDRLRDQYFSKTDDKINITDDADDLKEDHSTCFANDSEDKNENQTDVTTNVSQTDNTDESDTCEDYDSKDDIKKFLDDVESLQMSLINLTERSFDIKHDIELKSEDTIGGYILQNEVGLLNTYLSSIGVLYGNNLDRITQNIKDTLGL